ncbi:MAG: hypothetical protein ACMXYB_00165 [Candidatus Woesearchaeota archaeon]
MTQLTQVEEFRKLAFDRIGAILKSKGIENTLLRAQLSRDFIDVLSLLEEPSRTPLNDFANDQISITQLRDGSYFWGGVFCDRLRKSQLTPQHFSGTLSLAYSQIPQLYGGLVDKTDDILEAFYRAHKSLDEPERGVIRLFN